MIIKRPGRSIQERRGRFFAFYRPRPPVFMNNNWSGSQTKKSTAQRRQGTELCFWNFSTE
jgi:hypothetical protein